MASKRRQRRRSCGAKVRYTRGDAMFAAREIGRGLHAYRCDFGDHWHIGHPPSKVRQAIAARRDRL